MNLLIEKGKVSGWIWAGRQAAAVIRDLGRYRRAVRDEGRGGQDRLHGPHRRRTTSSARPSTTDPEDWGEQPAVTFHARKATLGAQPAADAADARLRACRVPPGVLGLDHRPCCGSGRATSSGRRRSTRPASTRRARRGSSAATRRRGRSTSRARCRATSSRCTSRRLRLNRDDRSQRRRARGPRDHQRLCRRPQGQRLQESHLEPRPGKGSGDAREASRAPEGPLRSGPADARLRRRRAGLRRRPIRTGDSGRYRRQHGLQRGPRRRDRLPSGVGQPGRSALSLATATRFRATAS